MFVNITVYVGRFISCLDNVCLVDVFLEAFGLGNLGDDGGYRSSVKIPCCSVPYLKGTTIAPYENIMSSFLPILNDTISAK